jgi:hypothetical protein
MATNADEIRIELDEVDPKAVANGAAHPPEVSADASDASPAESDLNEGIEKLKKQLADEKSAREAAERRAQTAAESEARARGEVQTTQLDLVKNAIEQLTQNSDALESQYADAASSADWGTAAKIQRQMAANAAKLQQLEAGKTQLERAPKPEVRAPEDEVEAFAARCTPKSAEWVRSHPEYVRDPKKNRMMIAAHELALAKGHTADTSDYFESIERTLDLRKDPQRVEASDDPTVEAASKPTPRKGSPPAAPPSRSGSAGGSSNPNSVRLSPAELEIAAMNDQTPEEYAKAKLSLKKEGRLN